MGINERMFYIRNHIMTNVHVLCLLQLCFNVHFLRITYIYSNPNTKLIIKLHILNSLANLRVESHVPIA